MAVVPYQDQQGSKKQQVSQMFDNISARYDLLNNVLSAGIHNLWKRKTIESLRPSAPKNLLDVATGTGDMAILAAKLLDTPQEIVGVDISEGMLAHGRKKLEKQGLESRITLQTGDSENLPFEDERFDSVVVSYGVRNFEDLEQGLRDIRRVMRPGGTLAVLEFSQPTVFPFKQLYGFYFRYILPTVGKAVSKDQAAYGYLHDSVQAFPFGDAFVEILKKTGFQSAKCHPLTFGITSLYIARK